MSGASSKNYRAVVSINEMDNLFEDPQMILPVDVLHRFQKVLRLRDGADIELLDGTGRLIKGFLRIMKNQGAIANAEVIRESPEEPPLWLAQALIRPNKLEPLIQKATEMGVTRILLWEAERCESRWYGDKDHKKKMRLEKIALEATRQSGRNVAPRIDGPLQSADFEAILKGDPCDWFVGSPQAEQWLSGSLTNFSTKMSRPLGVIIGPEGGLGLDELEGLRALEVRPVRFSPHILRTETAAFPFLCAVQWLRGRL